MVICLEIVLLVLFSFILFLSCCKQTLTPNDHQTVAEFSFLKLSVGLLWHQWLHPLRNRHNKWPDLTNRPKWGWFWSGAVIKYHAQPPRPASDVSFILTHHRRAPVNVFWHHQVLQYGANLVQVQFTSARGPRGQLPTQYQSHGPVDLYLSVCVRHKDGRQKEANRELALQCPAAWKQTLRTSCPMMSIYNVVEYQGQKDKQAQRGEGMRASWQMDLEFFQTPGAAAIPHKRFPCSAQGCTFPLGGRWRGRGLNVRHLHT